MVKFLIEKEEIRNINPLDLWGGTPLDDALRTKNWEIVEYLKSNDGVQGNSTKNEEVIKYSNLGDLQAIKQLKRQNVNFNVSDDDKRTPLHLTASNSHMDVLQFMVEKCDISNINVVDRWGGTAYDDAVR